MRRGREIAGTFIPQEIANTLFALSKMAITWAKDLVTLNVNMQG